MVNLSRIRRYELKYAITEKLAANIKDYISNICSLDKNVCSGESGYIVNNLYFDTSSLTFYNDTKFRKLTRYKPRARYYGKKAKDFIFPEIKYRNGNVIWKTRYCLPVEKFPELFYPVESQQVIPVIQTQMNRFEEIIHWYNAQPVLHVRYYREPYVTELEEYGRVTFDRQLCYRQVYGSTDLDYRESDMIYYDDPITTINHDSPVLLEIKVETLVPAWAINLIRRFNLVQRPFSKYCYGIDNMLGYLTPTRNSIFSYEA